MNGMPFQQRSPQDVHVDQQDCTTVLSATDVAVILANAEEFGLSFGVWYAINASEALVASHPSHTLAGRLGVSGDRLEELFEAANLCGKVSAVTKKLALMRSHSTPMPLSKVATQEGNTRTR